jgi:signal transduction histidine kinase
MGVNGYSPSIIIFVLWIFGSVFLIADLQMARIKSFLLFLKLNDAIQENARLAEEFHSSEMRFLIANVAHDLKTVSINPLAPELLR